MSVALANPWAVSADFESAREAFARGDYTAAFPDYVFLAETGNADAQNALGFMYATGLGVSENDVEVVRWLRLAATAGLAEAQYNLANMYARGEGLRRDDAAAFSWLQQAAAQGFVDAQNNLGVAYEHGLGVAKDLAAARNWYRLAAVAGQARAQYSLGMLHASLARDQEELIEAYAWCGLSAAQGIGAAVSCYRDVERRLDATGRDAARRRALAYRKNFTPPSADGDSAPAPRR